MSDQPDPDFVFVEPPDVDALVRQHHRRKFDNGRHQAEPLVTETPPQPEEE